MAPRRDPYVEEDFGAAGGLALLASRARCRALCNGSARCCPPWAQARRVGAGPGEADRAGASETDLAGRYRRTITTPTRLLPCHRELDLQRHELMGIHRRHTSTLGHPA
jgi:hypothetical protein